MPKIAQIRPVLLSAPYAVKGQNLEVELHLKSGYRTCGLVEVTLDDGTTGLGEGYLAVFAPRVFESIVELIAPHLIGREISELPVILEDIGTIINYWSLQGAARHVFSALDIALHDCSARVKGMPVYKLLGAPDAYPLEIYGSGGDSPGPESMTKEFSYLERLGIRKFKIRARNSQLLKALWCLEEGKQRSVDIALDMTQNLANPGQSAEEVLAFYGKIPDTLKERILFFEEALGLWNGQQYPSLRQRIGAKIAGGEIVTTPNDLISRMNKGWYDIVQPDATVIGGLSAMQELFNAAVSGKAEILVHCWGGPVGMMANYQAAIFGGCNLVEWPMPEYPLRDELAEHPWDIRGGMLYLPETAGLGMKLTKEIEAQYYFREDAIYSCLADPSVVPSDTVWSP